MLIEFNGASVDLSSLQTYGSLVTFLDNIPGQNKIDIRGHKPRNVDEKFFAKFDFLSSKEISIVNLLLSLVDKRKTLEDKLFPLNEGLANAITQMLLPD